jgi:hypothetical protein
MCVSTDLKIVEDMKCLICNQEVATQYYDDWLHHCCCAHHGTPTRCASCNKLLKPEEGYKISETKVICGFCKKDAVSTDSLNHYIDWVLDKLYKIGFQDIQRDWVKFELVENAILEQYSATGVHVDNGCVRSGRGLSDFDQTIRIANYLNKIELCQVLAHELIHAWQRMNDLEEFNKYGDDEIYHKVCEGFAQMGAYYIYEYIHTHSNDELIKSYTAYHKEWMEDNSDPIYGESFKIILDHFNQLREPKWFRLIKETREKKLKELFYEPK